MALSRTYLVSNQQAKSHLEEIKVWTREMKAMKICLDILAVKKWR